MKKTSKKRGRPLVDNPASLRLPSPRVTQEQFDTYREAAEVNDKPLTTWMKIELDKAAKRTLKR